MYLPKMKRWNIIILSLLSAYNVLNYSSVFNFSPVPICDIPERSPYVTIHTYKVLYMEWNKGLWRDSSMAKHFRNAETP